MKISKLPDILKAIITKPSYKSISNRLLILREISQRKLVIENISQAHETLLLKDTFKNPVYNIAYVRPFDRDKAGMALHFFAGLCPVGRSFIINMKSKI